MEFLGVIVAALGTFGLGGVWYMTLSKAWMAAADLTLEKIKSPGAKSPLPFILSFAAALSASGMMRHIFAASGVQGAGAGLISGLGLGAFMVAPWIVMSYAYAMRPRALWWIDGGYAVAAFGLMGLLNGLFR